MLASVNGGVNVIIPAFIAKVYRRKYIVKMYITYGVLFQQLK